ncbi:ABC transporter ATP-binding protein [Gottfriedia solisilvae]|uniref:Putative ABC transporter ATP-binding protein YfiC n=1 Tax=Gottfriedia solisilvae TaxID=1516104 RepID=A0A8J3AG99_9BACI|nr:ABC transporter ATP-binding protein [Gottfriedia solisilvae]GGI13319.1 putative ABC transporter ATP-binding protein YfiC [Gottfriedia solisilvae]
MLKELTKPFRYKHIPLQLKKNEKEKSRARNVSATLKRIWSYLSFMKAKLSLVLLLVLISSVLGLLGPVLVGYAIDHFIIKNNLHGLSMLIVSLIFIYLGYSASLFLQNYWMIEIAQNTVNKMRTELFKQFHKLPISFFEKRQHGELMSRVTNDLENVSSTLNSSVIQIFSSVLTLVGTVSVMIYYSPLLTLLTLSIVPILVVGIKWITNRTGQLYKIQQRNLGEMNGFIEETISGQRIIKTFSQEDKMIRDFLVKNEKLKTSGFWALIFAGFIPKFMNVLNNASFAIIAGIGGYFAFKDIISIGTIVIFTEYSRQFTRPLNDLSNQFNTLLSAIAGAERVFSILDEDVEAIDETNIIDHRKIIKGDVEFKNVCFSYGKDSNTLTEVSFKANSGESIALIGPTGAGKTTIVNLLSRFYTINSGDILIDGVKIENYSRKNLREQMAFVLQDSFLFKGTIRENIRYGRLDASDKEVEEAAKLANAHNFITKTPNGYDTILQQDDGQISQGQKQLLSIARAILANPAILILDEATSSIDTITEIKIQEALLRLMEGRTSFVIAHRLNTIKNANQILVLQDGMCVERGTHDELLNQQGFYYELVNHQGMNEDQHIQ